MKTHKLILAVILSGLAWSAQAADVAGKWIGEFDTQVGHQKYTFNFQKAGDKLKEIQLSAVIDPHDFETKISHAIDFLSGDIKVRVKLRFKGRQKAHKEFGFEVINRFVRALAAYGQSDSPPKLLGDRDLNVLVTPLPREKRPKLAVM